MRKIRERKKKPKIRISLTCSQCGKSFIAGDRLAAYIGIGRIDKASVTCSPKCRIKQWKRVNKIVVVREGKGVYNRKLDGERTTKECIKHENVETLA